MGKTEASFRDTLVREGHTEAEEKKDKEPTTLTSVKNQTPWQTAAFSLCNSNINNYLSKNSLLLTAPSLNLDHQRKSIKSFRLFSKQMETKGVTVKLPAVTR